MSHIKRVSVQGYKSLGHVTIEMGKLTMLAGRNNTGKSSAMHPLLLIRQSLNNIGDTKNILVTWGPHVMLSSAREALGAETGKFIVRIETEKGVGEWTFCAEKDLLKVTRCQWGYDTVVLLHPNMSEQEISAAARVLFPGPPAVHIDWKDFKLVACRASLILVPRFVETVSAEVFDYFVPPPPWVPIHKAIQTLIHVPSGRAGREFAYMFTTPVGPMPGGFANYLAGILHQWKEMGEGKLEEIESDLSSLELAQKIDVRRLDATSAEILVLPFSDSREYVNIASTGAGLLSALPVVVALRAARPGQIVYIEHPEENLHPAAQFGMAGLLIETARRGARVIVETHSEFVLWGIQAAIALGNLPPGEVVLNWFEKGDAGVVVTADTIDRDGAFSCAVDFGEVALFAMRAYLDAVANQQAYRQKTDTTPH